MTLLAFLATVQMDLACTIVFAAGGFAEGAGSFGCQFDGFLFAFAGVG